MRLQVPISRQLCHSAVSDDVSSRHKWVFSLCPLGGVRRQPSSPLSLVEHPSHILLLLSLLSFSPLAPTDCLPFLSRTLQWSLTSNIVICHKCLMSHSRRKWDDHMIRLNCKHLANAIRQPNLDIVAVGGFLSVCIRSCFASLSSPPFCSVTHFVVSSVSFQQTSVPLLLFSVFSHLVLPSFFSLPSHLALLHCHWQGVIPSLCC